jgi:hypothetical protein
MSIDAQIAANQATSQFSTGPTSVEGKAASCLNNLKYGLTGSSFSVLPWETKKNSKPFAPPSAPALHPQARSSRSWWTERTGRWGPVVPAL